MSFWEDQNILIFVESLPNFFIKTVVAYDRFEEELSWLFNLNILLFYFHFLVRNDFWYFNTRFVLDIESCSWLKFFKFCVFPKQITWFYFMDCSFSQLFLNILVSSHLYRADALQVATHLYSFHRDRCYYGSEASKIRNENDLD